MPGTVLLLLAGVALADEADTRPTAPHTEEPSLEVVLVRGRQPGPGLWKVSSGDHVLWILGEISPYPRKVKWKAEKFDKLLRHSQELLLDFSGYWRADKGDITAYSRAEKLPEGVTLKDVVAPDLYARVEKTARIFGASGLEGLHPFSATNRLVMSAMKTLDMDGFSARFAAEDLGQRRHVRITYFDMPEIAFTDRLLNWQDASNSVCLERLVDAIEDGGAGVKRLANAWSVGNIGALRQLVPEFSFSRDGFRAQECAAAMHGSEQQARTYKDRRTKSWVQEAERALQENRSTMAVVLMSELFAPDGYLAGLRARGYQIVEPE
jgi:TraB family protein